MSEHKHGKRHGNNNSYNRNPAPSLDDVSKADDGMEEQEEWKPTREQMNAYLVREVELARTNIITVLGRARNPQSFKELKDSTLHTSETIDQALQTHLTNGKVKEVQGRYSL